MCTSLLALKFALMSFGNQYRGVHLKRLVDNVTAVAFIPELRGTHSLVCNFIAQEIWHWAAERRIWLSIAHLAGTDNTATHYESRHFHKATEGQIHPAVFAHVVKHFGAHVDIDLMASCTNHQVARYISWRPDPPRQWPLMLLSQTGLPYLCGVSHLLA